MVQKSPIIMDSSGPIPPPQPRYVMLQENSGSLRPPPYRRNVLQYQSNNHREGHCCLRFICCCYCFIFILIFILALVAFFLFVVYQPQRPSYNVDQFNVNALNMKSDMNPNIEIEVIVKAVNPNERIGFTYGGNSKVIVSFQGFTLCSGKLPAFHQPSKNTTMVMVVLQGNNQFNSKLQQALMESQQTKKVPLLVMVKAPVSIVLGEFPLRQVVFFVNFSLVLDDFAPNQKIKILSSSYTYEVSI